jgi:hypothetical protein
MEITRRQWLGIAALAATLRADAQTGAAAAVGGPEGFKVYTDAPRLFLSAARLKLLRRERDRRSLRWEQFQTLWGADAQFPEFGWTSALRYQIAQEDSAGQQAVTWATEKAGSVDAAGLSDGVARQMALIADWCAPHISAENKRLIFARMERIVTGDAPAGLAEARTKTLAAIALADARPEVSQKALREIYEEFWTARFIAGLRDGKLHVTNADAYPMLELMHAFRDNLNFDLRETLPKWFKDYPLIHILAHYPEPFPGAENEYRIPADVEIDKRGPNVTKATLSRAAELAMVAFDANAPETQLLQGFLMNDRFLMRGALGIAYETMWANPYQPGLSYYHVPLVAHDAVGGELFLRSTWEDDAAWLGFFEGQLQLFANGELARVDPAAAHEPIDMGEAAVFFANLATKFRVPERKAVAAATGDDAGGDGSDAMADVFIIGLEPLRRYHVEADGEGMFEAPSDVGGIIYLPGLPSGAQVRFGLAPAV